MSKTHDGYKPRKSVPCQKGDTQDAQGANIAKLATSPELSAFRIIDASENVSGMRENLDVPSLLQELKEQAFDANKGDLSRAEGMLINQAVALQGLFTTLVEKALATQHINQFDSYMKMGLRAQSQCRASLETLNNIKSPPVIYASQANVTSGPQQINNTIAEKKENLPNQVLGDIKDEQWVDRRTASKTFGGDQALEAMVKVHRPKNTRGKSEVS